MKLYPKKLHSLEELKREKQVLKYAQKYTRAESLMPIDKSSMNLNRLSKESSVLAYAGDILTSKSAIDVALAVGMPLIKTIGRKTEKGILKSVVGEVFGGYIKWKAVELGAKAVLRMMKNQKRKKAEANHA